MPSKPFSYRYDHIKFTKVVPQLKKNLLITLGVFGRRVSGKGALGLSRHLQRSGDYAENNPWWHDAKNKKRVFYDTGFWRNSPTYKILPVGGDVLAAVEVGFVSTTAHPSDRQKGDFNVQRIATFLQRGATWTPSPRQRQKFWARIRKMGAKIDPSKIQPKSSYVNPPRDFVKKHLKSPKVTALFIAQIDAAVKRTYKTMPRKKVSG